jgi:hypothetical protein
MKAEIAQMLKQGNGGAIVNTSSMAGLVGSVGGPPMSRPNMVWLD